MENYFNVNLGIQYKLNKNVKYICCRIYGSVDSGELSNFLF